MTLSGILSLCQTGIFRRFSLYTHRISQFLKDGLKAGGGMVGGDFCRFLRLVGKYVESNTVARDEERTQRSSESAMGGGEARSALLCV